MSDVEIIIARDFSVLPIGRYASDGAASAEVFRKQHLGPALLDHDIVTVVLDGVMGFGSSFLEEAFGGLVRDGLSKPMISKLNIVSEIPFLIDDIKRYIEEAQRNNGNR